MVERTRRVGLAVDFGCWVPGGLGLGMAGWSRYVFVAHLFAAFCGLMPCPSLVLPCQPNLLQTSSLVLRRHTRQPNSFQTSSTPLPVLPFVDLRAPPSQPAFVLTGRIASARAYLCRPFLARRRGLGERRESRCRGQGTGGGRDVHDGQTVVRGKLSLSSFTSEGVANYLHVS